MCLNRSHHHFYTMNAVATVRIVIGARLRIYAVQIRNALALTYNKCRVYRVFEQSIYMQRQNRNYHVFVFFRLYILVFAGIVVFLTFPFITLAVTDRLLLAHGVQMSRINNHTDDAVATVYTRANGVKRTR